MIELRISDVRATVDAARGGRLASLLVAGRERLVTAGPGAAADTMWGCFVMAPWVGRLAHGRLPWEGRVLPVPVNFGRHAIHGVVFDTPWEVEEKDETHARLSCRFDERWPLGGWVVQELRLREASLEVMVEIEAASQAMPAAVGWHPWFDGATRPIKVRVDAERVLITDDEMVPTGESLPVTEATDLRAGPLLGSRRLDHAYVHAVGPALVDWQDLSLRIDFGPPLETVVVYTPENAVCVEPQTAWPNAFALDVRGTLGTGTTRLGAGDRLRAAMRWSWAVR